jgi:hypothetical protein
MKVVRFEKVFGEKITVIERGEALRTTYGLIRPGSSSFFLSVGIGSPDPSVNPFFANRYPSIEKLFGGRMLSRGDSRRETHDRSARPVNATLGVPGLPQSGTGQTALLTGVNAPKLIGGHFGPYPHSAIRPVLEEKNIFHVLALRGRSPFYANAFPRGTSDISQHRRARPRLRQRGVQPAFR